MNPADKLRRILLKQYGPPKGKGKATIACADRVPVAEGHVKIEAVYPDGRREVLVDDKNKVVTQAETIMPYMTLGTRTMSYIELGDPSPATTPALTDTNLEQTTGQRKAISGSVSTNTATYSAQWLTTEGNGYTYTEAGLFSDPFGAGLMFARKTFNPIVKTNAFALNISWTLVFNVADHNDGCSGIALYGASAVTQDYEYTSTSGGETEIEIPIDFVIGAKNLDAHMNHLRMYYNTNYYESVVGSTKGIKFVGFVANPGDVFYFTRRG